MHAEPQENWCFGKQSLRYPERQCDPGDFHITLPLCDDLKECLRGSPGSVGSMGAGGTSDQSKSMRTAASGRRGTSNILSDGVSVAFEDTGTCNMRDRMVAKKTKVAEEANRQLSTKKKAPKMTKNAEAGEDGR